MQKDHPQKKLDGWVKYFKWSAACQMQVRKLTSLEHGEEFPEIERNCERRINWLQLTTKAVHPQRSKSMQSEPTLR